MTTYVDVFPMKGHIDRSDMKQAVHKANCNLLSRHRIFISLDSKKMPIGYRIRISSDKDKIEEFLKNPGLRLKGVSAYLLKTWPEKYEPLRGAGKRLLIYHVPSNMEKEGEEQ